MDIIQIAIAAFGQNVRVRVRVRVCVCVQDADCKMGSRPSTVVGSRVVSRGKSKQKDRIQPDEWNEKGKRGRKGKKRKIC